jgi:tetratricopeptide (TPR) repeat protein
MLPLSSTWIRHLGVTAALAAAAVLASPAGAAVKKDDDVLIMLDGAQRVVVVASEEYTGLRTKDGETIPWEQVVTVTYGDHPEFTQAMDALRAGNVEGALGGFEAVAQSTKRQVVKQNALFQRARALQTIGRPAEAADAYGELVRAFPRSRYLYEAGEGLVDCLLAGGDGAEAQVSSFCSQASAALDGGFKAESGLLRGRVLAAQAKWEEARGAYDDARVAQGARESMVQRGTLGVAQCLQALNKRSEAENLYRSLVGSSAPSHVLAGAWNGLADFTKQDARKNTDADRMLDALYQYLRGVVQYAPQAGEATIEYERALAGAGECFKYLAELTSNKELKGEYLARSRQRYEQLAKECPGSALIPR